MTSEDAVRIAREYFPRGLKQPEDGYRFSIDSLLLAAFARDVKGRVMDLACGCGVVGLGMLLESRDVRVTGLDANPELLECSKANAKLLGVVDRFEHVRCDVRTVSEKRPFEPESFDAVVMNPPYRDPGSGRTPEGMRLPARFEAQARLDDFISAAAFGLKNKGRLDVVFLPGRLAALFKALDNAALEPKRLMLVHGGAEERAKIALVEARKNGGPGLHAEPPLILYAGGVMTSGALAFCPALGCNPGGE
jgi:tRNA1Val (adenine37-N6)-methyltransferase